MSRKLFEPVERTPEQIAVRRALEQAVKSSVARVKAMSPEEYEEMKRVQAQSWARQDKD